MRILHAAGFKTFASIEPIIDFPSSLQMIEQTLGHCDHYKIGLLSGAKPLLLELAQFIGRANMLIHRSGATVYWKDSITKLFPMQGESIVPRDYNIFTNPTTLTQYQ